jgi:hypothetical protein
MRSVQHHIAMYVPIRTSRRAAGVAELPCIAEQTRHLELPGRPSLVARRTWHRGAYFSIAGPIRKHARIGHVLERWDSGIALLGYSYPHKTFLLAVDDSEVIFVHPRISHANFEKCCKKEP